MESFELTHLFPFHFIIGYDVLLATSTTIMLTWIFPGVPLNMYGAPGNIQANLTALHKISRSLEYVKLGVKIITAS